MIAPMKRVTVLCLASDEEATLEHLRALGILHLAPVQLPEAPDVEAARRELTRVRRVLDVLPARAAGAPAAGRPARETVEAVWALVQRRKTVDDDLEALRHERQRIEPLGAFDPAQVRALADKGVRVRFFQIEPGREPAAPAGVAIHGLARTRSATYFAAIHRGEAEIEGREIRLPERSLAEIDRRLAAREAERLAVASELASHAGERPAVAALALEAADRLAFARARAGMGRAARVAYLRGFCPEAGVACIREAAAQGGWGFRIEDPSADDPVPTLLRNAGWVSPIHALFRMIGILPGYRETDVSVAFLVFFSLFFAMLVGDAGYGAIFLGLTLWARRRLPKAPRELLSLSLITSVATIVWGVLTGTYFGLAPDAVPAVLRGLRVGWLGVEENLQYLCFVIGASHITLAHVWNIVRMRRSAQALAQIGWIATTWTMFFYACMMVLGRSFPGVMMPVFIGGVAMIVLFMTPPRALKEEWFNHVLLPLNLVSNFVDVVSYIRLFAVGTASYAVASSFNEMLSGLLGHWATAVLAAVFLFVTHTFNIALSIMGVMVHGVRLNTLEFSGHVGLQWTGIPYEPFRSGSAAEPGAEAAR
jgi:V/A-type H+-transporting ATPase subunit I